jgi:hypothetical protein
MVRPRTGKEFMKRTSSALAFSIFTRWSNSARVVFFIQGAAMGDSLLDGCLRVSIKPRTTPDLALLVSEGGSEPYVYAMEGAEFDLLDPSECPVKEPNSGEWSEVVRVKLKGGQLFILACSLAPL